MLNENFYITVDGISLSCQRIIPMDVMEDAPTIIFLHEALGTIRMWRDFPAKFATATKHPVIIYERRGHGRSDPHGDGDVPRPIDFHNVESDVYLSYPKPPMCLLKTSPLPGSTMPPRSMPRPTGKPNSNAIIFSRPTWCSNHGSIHGANRHFATGTWLTNCPTSPARFW